MRIAFLRLALSCALMVAATADAALQVHLTFDENVGATSFNDGLSGATNDAPLNAVNTRPVGQLGSAIGFNDTIGSSIVAGANPLPEDTLRTISFWLNTTTSGGGLDTYVSFGTNNNPSGATDPGTKFDISVDNATGHLEVGVGGGRTDSGAASPSTPTVNDGVWRLATVAIPDIADDDPLAADLSDIDFYVDGVFSYSGSFNNSADRTISTNPNGSLFLGRRANDGGGEFVTGSMDDLAVWDEPLTPDEIKGLYDAGSVLNVDAGVYDQVLALHDAGAGTIFAGDYQWSFASGLTTAAGVTGSNLVLSDASNTGVTFSALTPGDVDRNGVVNQADFEVIRTNFMSSATSRDQGDLNGDGFVDFFDFRLWKDASNASFTVTIPEPTTLALAALLGAAFVARRVRPGVIAVAAFAVALGSADEGHAQATNVFFTQASGDYSINGNWDTGFVPEDFLDEIAVIGSVTSNGMLVGAAGDATATLGNTPLSPAGVLLGDGLGAIGRLDITSTGSLSVPGTTTVTSGVQVGQGDNGRGFLTIAPGGSLSAYAVNLNGQTDGFEESDWSKITLSGNASLTSTTANLQFNRVIEVTGPDVTVQSAADMGIGTRGRYIANITGATHSVMSAPGELELDGGVLIPNFSGSAAPTEGSSWDLFDSGTVVGNFSEVRVPNKVAGQGFVIEQRAGGNGVITSLAVRSVLVLEVNRDTGQVDITQPFGSPISIDGYSIESGSGNLGSATWTSLDSQNVSDWTEANATTTALNELKPIGSTAFSGPGFSLGTAYTPDFSTFGQTIEDDLVFEYFDTTSGQLVQGEVVYSGVKINDLVLIVDPTTGEAQLRNTSNASVGIDGYQISSASGALLTGGWDSLAGQATADWFVAEESSINLTELLPAGVETLAGDTGYNLGAIFSTTGVQDLTLDYLAAGANVLQPGQVLYDELPALFEGLAGDYNDDGTVDAADYTVWRDGLPLDNESVTIGFNTPEDYDVWVSQFGQTAATATAVPEASAGVLALIAACFGLTRRRSVAAAVAPAASVSPRCGFAAKFVAAAAVMAFGVASATAQTVLFDHNFENAPNPGTAVTSLGDLGTPTTGSMSFSGSAFGGIGGTRPALAVGFNSNGIANMTQPTENSVTFSGVFPETVTADAGSGDRVFADFASAGDITSTTLSTDISFAFGHFGTSNTGDFKHTYIRGLDGVGNEVFELLWVAGSGNNIRQWYARGPSDDSITRTAANTGNPDGQLLANGFNNATNGTNVANGRPSESIQVDISLSNSMVTFDISSTNGTGNATAVNGMALPINSAATSISQLEFGTLWSAGINGQNNGFWVDDLFATTTPIGSFPLGDVNLDGFVDQTDFSIIAANFKESASSRSQGDLNDDGFVDFADFRIWKEAPPILPPAALVPEPSAVSMALLPLVCLRARRR